MRISSKIADGSGTPSPRREEKRDGRGRGRGPSHATREEAVALSDVVGIEEEDEGNFAVNVTISVGGRT